MYLIRQSSTLEKQAGTTEMASFKAIIFLALFAMALAAEENVREKKGVATYLGGYGYSAYPYSAAAYHAVTPSYYNTYHAVAPSYYSAYHAPAPAYYSAAAYHAPTYYSGYHAPYAYSYLH